jgi:hypothetical protein
VTCAEGYSGGGEAECTTLGEFSRVTCTAKACESTQVANSNKDTDDEIQGVTGGVVAVICDTGYSGSADATCGTDGFFSVVTCSPDPCTATKVDFSVAHTSDASISGVTGDKVEVTCAEGYSGSGTAVCQPSGEFTTVTCTPNPCEATEVAFSVDHAYPRAIFGVTSDKVEVTCAEGYSGSGTAVCQPSSFFSVVTCTPNPCTATKVDFSVAHSSDASISGVTGDKVEVTCSQGYSGSGTAVCQPDGEFTTVTCTPDPCEATEVANSKQAAHDAITGVTGDSVPVTCDIGYTGSAAAAVCGTDGVFTTVTCEPNPCQATQVANSYKASSGVIVGVTGDRVPVTCNVGYSGTADAVCGTDGLFSVVECTPNPCEPTEVEFSMAFTAADSITGVTGDVVQVTCADGYQGSGNAVCGTDGTFSTVSCMPVSCGPLTVADSTRSDPLNPIWGKTGAEREIICLDGYAPGGTAICTAGVGPTAAWVAPVCESTSACPCSDKCNVCSGKVTELTIVAKPGVSLPAGDIKFYLGQPGKRKTSSLPGTWDGEGRYTVKARYGSTLGTWLSIRLGNGRYLGVHTSCSVPIGPGYDIEGVFTVTRGKSHNGGLLCAMDCLCAKCDNNDDKDGKDDKDDDDDKDGYVCPNDDSKDDKDDKDDDDDKDKKWGRRLFQSEGEFNFIFEKPSDSEEAGDSLSLDCSINNGGCDQMCVRGSCYCWEGYELMDSQCIQVDSPCNEFGCTVFQLKKEIHFLKLENAQAAAAAATAVDTEASGTTITVEGFLAGLAGVGLILGVRAFKRKSPEQAPPSLPSTPARGYAGASMELTTLKSGLVRPETPSREA